jgi:hypothetical protein
MARAYEDAYHQFIEPVVGASGEQLAQSDPGPGDGAQGTSDGMRPAHDGDRIFGA